MIAHDGQITDKDGQPFNPETPQGGVKRAPSAPAQEANQAAPLERDAVPLDRKAEQAHVKAEDPKKDPKRKAAP